MPCLTTPHILDIAHTPPPAWLNFVRPTSHTPRLLLSRLARPSSIPLATGGIVHSCRFHCLRRQSFQGRISPLRAGSVATAPSATTLGPLRRDGTGPPTASRALIAYNTSARRSTDFLSRVRAGERAQLRYIAGVEVRSNTAAGTQNSRNNKGGMEDDFQDAADAIEDRALAARGGRGRRGGGGGRRGGGGGGGGAGGPNRQVQISKALSTLLRHQAQNAGIPLDTEGFAPLDRVMQWPRLRNLNPTVKDIREEVATNAKQRFSMKPHPDSFVAGTTGEDDAAHWVIRANQGHTIAVASEALHTPITLAAGNVPAVVVHGTYFAFWDAIVAAGGLKKMGRTHVHFGTGVPGDDGSSGGAQRVHGVDEEVAVAADGKPKVISGMRSDAELLIFVDIERALRDSTAAAATTDEGEGEGKSKSGEGGEIKWWMSENNVVLTEGNADGVVPLKYFKEVRGRRQGVGVLWKDGEKVADLPSNVVARVPQGKMRGGGGGGGGGKGGRGGRRGGRGRGGGS